MTALHRQQTRRWIIRLPADVDRELTRLAHERGRRQASLLLEAFEDWLHRQEVRVEMLDERPHREPVPLATIRF